LNKVAARISSQSASLNLDAATDFWRKHWPIIVLVLIWVVMHVKSVATVELKSQWEIRQAAKLLDYGFLARKGALLEPQLDTGRLAFPDDLNYTHHPHLMVWIYTLLYAMGGGWLCFVALLGLRLAATLVLYRLLASYFSVRAAFCATVIFICAPAAMAMDVETNIIGIAAAYWPIAAWMANRVREENRGLLALGAFIIFGGQTSWLFLSTLPALVWLAAPPGTALRQLILKPFALKSTRVIIISGVLTLLLFIMQMVVYTKDWGSAGNYLAAQMGHATLSEFDSQPTWKRATLMYLRTLYYLGPALALGAVLGGFLRSMQKSQRLVEAALVYVAVYICVSLLLMRFCLVEVSPYLYLLSPLAILAAASLQRFASIRYSAGLMSLAALSVSVYMIRDSYPKRALAVAPLVELVSKHTSRDQIILTNLKPHSPPFAAVDNIGPYLVGAEADRLISYDVSSSSSFDGMRKRLMRNFRNVIFMYCPEMPVDPQFLTWVKQNSSLESTQHVFIASEPPNLASKIQLAIWRINGRTQVQANSPTAGGEYSFYFYRLPY
jgi:hypothetical protein